MARPSYPSNVIADLITGRLPWEQTKRIMSDYKDADRIVKCDCGQEFGDYHQNWKLSALIRVRSTPASLEPIYPGPRKPDPNWMEIREYICPNCTTLLEVDAVPPGWPVIFDFLPDLEGFYEEWL